jgi:hypothetical protein
VTLKLIKRIIVVHTCGLQANPIDSSQPPNYMISHKARLLTVNTFSVS